MSSTNNQRFAFQTIGCRANQFQTEAIKSQLLAPNSTIVPFNQPADVYVINTCAVTLDAERTSLQSIRRALKQNPKAKIIIDGCLSRLYSDRLAKEFPQVTIQQPKKENIFPQIKELSKVRVRENLMIEDGCESFCSYCIVPFARGKIKSKPIKQIVLEAELLANAGAKELVITGINLGAYGKDLSGNSLLDVIKEISGLEKILRIRLSSIEPIYLTEYLINLLASNPKLCHSLHIPLQSGDNAILEAMRRSYKSTDFLKIINQARQNIPDCGISTDIIVGFPGEDDKAFNNTIKLVEKIKFSRLHVFPYSKRPGTAAASYSNQINPKIIKQRVKHLRSIGKRLAVEFANDYLNQEVEVLVEAKRIGLTPNYIKCHLDGNIGQIKTIRAISVNASGEIIG